MFVLVAFQRASQRIVLGEASVHFSGMAKSPRQVAYEDIQGLDIFSGAKASWLVVQTISHGSMRVYFEPFSNSEWAKFIEVVAIKAPHASMSPRVKQMFD